MKCVMWLNSGKLSMIVLHFYTSSLPNFTIKIMINNFFVSKLAKMAFGSTRASIKHQPRFNMVCTIFTIIRLHATRKKPTISIFLQAFKYAQVLIIQITFEDRVTCVIFEKKFEIHRYVLLLFPYLPVSVPHLGFKTNFPAIFCMQHPSISFFFS